MPQLKNEGETFGEWLFAQKDRKAAVADLINSAKADRAFPRPDSPDDVRMHLNEMQAAGRRNRRLRNRPAALLMPVHGTRP